MGKPNVKCNLDNKKNSRERGETGTIQKQNSVWFWKEVGIGSSQIVAN